MSKTGKQNRSLLGIVLWLFGFSLFLILPEYFERYAVFFVLLLLMLTVAIIKINR